MEIMTIILQGCFFIVAAPLVSGFIAKLKNNFRMRKGQSIVWPYSNLVKLFGKGEVVSETASWIFKAAPFIVFSSSMAAALLVPVVIMPNLMQHAGDFLALIFIFALGRFFLTLAALDTGSAFGGMGSSREMFIASLAEPVACLVAFVLFLHFGSTSIASSSGLHPVSISLCIGAIALFLVILAETSRIPVDNQETHLELTMIHEAMVLEYSGRRLALIELAAHIKQLIWFLLIAQIVFPISAPDFGSGLLFITWFLWFVARLVIIGLIVAVVEVSVAKMRLFRVMDFFGFAFVFGVIAVVCAIMGV